MPETRIDETEVGGRMLPFSLIRRCVMDHFKGISETERYNNDLLNEIRKLNLNLEKVLSNKPTERRLKNDNVSKVNSNRGRRSNAK